MINVLELLKNDGIEPRRAGNSHGGEFHSSCPGCGDGSPRPADKGPSDRFQVWPDRREGGYYTCRRCGKHGDNIQYLRDFRGMSYRDARAELGLPPTNKCHSRLPLTPKLTSRGQNTAGFEARAHDLPAAAWQEKAAAFVDHCHDCLLKTAPVLTDLHDRGLTLVTIRHHRLGWNTADIYRDRMAWGLPPVAGDNGRQKPLWLPAGLVTPLLHDDRPVQIRIRRPDHARAEFMPDLKYYVLPGSSMATMTIHPQAEAFVVVEAGLDALLVAQECGGQVGAVSVWNATAKPDAGTTALLRNALRVLVALDADEPGDKAVAWWLEQFGNARRLRPQGGKDPGDMARTGIDVAAWVKAALPPALTLFMVPAHAQGSEAADTAEGPGLIPSGLSVTEGAAAENCSLAGDADQRKGGWQRLAALLRQYRLKIRRADDGRAVSIVGLERCAPEIAAEVSGIVWNDPAVGRVIDAHSDGLIGPQEVENGC